MPPIIPFMGIPVFIDPVLIPPGIEVPLDIEPLLDIPLIIDII